MLSSVAAAAAEVGEISTNEDSDNSQGTGTSEASEDSKYTEPSPSCSSKPCIITLHFPW